MDFKKPTLEDKPLIDHYLSQVNYYGCEFTFANFYLWSFYYRVQFAVVEDMLVFRSEQDEGDRTLYSFSYPVGAGAVRSVIERLMDFCKETDMPFRMYNVTPEMQAEVEREFPGKFNFMPDRDNFDYIYNTEDLIELKGKKYHGKRNHINKFMESDWGYEPITADNMQECWEMNQAWCRENGCDDSETKQAEYCVVHNSFDHFETLGLHGGLIRQNGRVVAFSLGEPINKDVFVVHIEKAFSDVQGAYPIINREFAAHEAKDYPYINREEDMGLEGLRKAKLSYRPAILLEKAVMTIQPEA